MKKTRLIQIIREEISKVLKENAPAKEKETKEAPTKPDTDTEKEKKRRGFDKPEPGVKPKPKAGLKENEKELAKKIADKFLKLKK